MPWDDSHLQVSCIFEEHPPTACTALSAFHIAALKVGALGSVFQWIEEATRLIGASILGMLI